MDISVIIPVLDEAVYLDSCLAASSLQRFPRDRYEIIGVSVFQPATPEYR